MHVKVLWDKCTVCPVMNDARCSSIWHTQLYSTGHGSMCMAYYTITGRFQGLIWLELSQGVFLFWGGYHLVIITEKEREAELIPYYNLTVEFAVLTWQTLYSCYSWRYSLNYTSGHPKIQYISIRALYPVFHGTDTTTLTKKLVKINEWMNNPLNFNCIKFTLHHFFLLSPFHTAFLFTASQRISSIFLDLIRASILRASLDTSLYASIIKVKNSRPQVFKELMKDLLSLFLSFLIFFSLFAPNPYLAYSLKIKV